MRLRERELAIDSLPRELDGLRVAHLSDFHLGIHGRGPSAVERAVDWVAERKPDLACITGDLLSKPKGEPQLRVLLAKLDNPYVVLGNHDFAHSRDPFSKPAAIAHVENGTLLNDEQVEIELRGVRIEIGGVDPLSWLSYRPSSFTPSDAGFRLLLCHFPRVLDFVDPGRWQLILAGHLHGGQIVLPYGRGRFLFAHPRAPYAEGVFERGGTTMHVSPGLGTTFVPFRYFARPEATELVLRCK
ncbi:MAG TPA: metallophosphoesterase [Gaiellaceae bacterium]|nr:metallophosphoesterase [Gaiellaceae bacterium]